jgi:hypothetical protein
MMSEKPSYHDVVVFVGGDSYRIFDLPFSVILQSTRAGGWQLWKQDEPGAGPEQLIGGEYDVEDFRIEVCGVVVCQSPPRSDCITESRLNEARAYRLALGPPKS